MFFAMSVSRDFQPANFASYSARLSDETSMGANKTYQQKGDRGRLLGESSEFKRLRRAVEKAHGDRDSAIAFVAGSITCPRSRRYPLRFEPLRSRCSEHQRIDAKPGSWRITPHLRRALPTSERDLRPRGGVSRRTRQSAVAYCHQRDRSGGRIQSRSRTCVGATPSLEPGDPRSCNPGATVDSTLIAKFRFNRMKRRRDRLTRMTVGPAVTR